MLPLPLQKKAIISLPTKAIMSNAKFTGLAANHAMVMQVIDLY